MQHGVQGPQFGNLWVRGSHKAQKKLSLVHHDSSRSQLYWTVVGASILLSGGGCPYFCPCNDTTASCYWQRLYTVSCYCHRLSGSDPSHLCLLLTCLAPNGWHLPRRRSANWARRDWFKARCEGLFFSRWHNWLMRERQRERERERGSKILPVVGNPLSYYSRDPSDFPPACSSQMYWGSHF